MKLRTVRQGLGILVLGTDQIAVAAEFAGMKNDRGIFWLSSNGGHYARRRGQWTPVSDGEFSPKPKDAKPGVRFHGVRTVPTPGVPLMDRQGDVWTLGADGLMHTPETAPFPHAYVEKKWGPLIPASVDSGRDDG